MNNGLKGCGEVKDGTERKCIDCDIPVFERNNYFCGKLMVERDFWCDQRYHMGKQRRHNKDAHGWGTLCGLKVEQHPKEECRHKYVIIKPGVALDCCGREIIVNEDQRIPLPEEKDADVVVEKKNIYLAIRYGECYTEPVPSLYSDCGCDDKCEPNRIKETFEIKLLNEDEFGELPDTYEPCANAFEDKQCDEICKKVIEPCPECPQEPLNRWVILASVEGYTPGDKVTESTIDNFTHRRLVPSTDTLYELIRCLMKTGAGEKGEKGDTGEDGPEGPQGEQGPPGTDGKDGDDGKDGIGLDPNLPKIKKIEPSFEETINLVDLTDGIKITVYFDRDMNTETINKNTFVVRADFPDKEHGIYQNYRVMGKIIYSSTENSATFEMHGKFIDFLRSEILGAMELTKVTCWVLLKGDFILDTEGLPLDGDHLTRDPITGKPTSGLPSGDWVPGGDFESWFEINLKN